MNGVHDMGGMHGMGPVAPEADEPVFHARWEGRTHALTLASPTRGNIDAGRHRLELIAPADYLRMTYYERWLTRLEELLVAGGFVTAGELASGRADPASAKATPRLTADAVASALTRPASYVREAAAPLFEPGDRVRARDLNPPGHTRLPRYVRGRIGTVERRHGAHVFPDSHAHGLGEDPRPLYGVRFAAQELWGPEASPRDSVSLDLWEPYLECAGVLALPRLPRDADGPVFAEPWQAQAFALTLKLNEAGAFTWAEWAAALSRELATDPADDGSRYYEHWVAALETLAAARNLTAPEELVSRRNAWRDAYLRTPHGRPVEL